MILLQARRRRLASRGMLPACGLVLAVVFAAGFASGAGSGQPQPAGSKERLRELMTQRYEILQRAVQNAKLLLGQDRMEVPTFQNLTDARYRAQADLSETAADRIKVYEELVDALVAVQQILDRQALAGRATQVQVDQGKLTIVNAQIDLERLRLGETPARP